jgi:hypothetical protein
MACLENMSLKKAAPVSLHLQNHQPNNSKDRPENKKTSFSGRNINLQPPLQNLQHLLT